MARSATEECKHRSRAPQRMLRDLNDAQGGMGRHRCAACAYVKALTEVELGVSAHGAMIECSHGNVAPESILRSLPENQGGSGRHKCVVCAYQQGHADARGVAVGAAWDPTASTGVGSLTETDERGTTSLANTDLERDEARLKEIGDIGEALVLDYEKGSLIAAGRTDLANQVTHVAVTEGDSAGYDVRSYEEDGSVKHIEVKATEGAVENTFFLTANELRFAKANAATYCLYRLHGLDVTLKTAEFLVLRGDPEDYCSLSSIQYRATLKRGI